MEPELSKAELKRRAKLAKAEAKAQARAAKDRAVLQQQFEKQQREQVKADEKRRADDPEFAAEAEKAEAEDDWQVFSLQPGLALRVEEARDLREKGKSINPYIIVKCGDETFRTDAAKDDGANPAPNQNQVWREFFTFPDCPETGRVDLEVWDQKFLARDIPLGMVGLKAQQVMDLQSQSAEGQLDIWLYLQPLASCSSPTGSIRLIATMGDRKTKRKLRHGAKKSSGKQAAHDEPSEKHSPGKDKQFRSRKELSKVTAASREAEAQARATQQMEAYLLELDRQRMEAEAAAAVAEKEAQEKQEAELKLIEAKKEAQLAAEAAAQEEAELLQAEERAAAEKTELDAAREKVTNIEQSLAEAREKGTVEDQERLLRELEKARHTEEAERADYQAAEERRAKEKMDAEHARDALSQQTAATNAAEQAYFQEAEEALVAAEAARRANAAAEYAAEIPSIIRSEEGEDVNKLEQEDDAARLRAEQEPVLIDSTQGQRTQGQRTQRVQLQRTINDPKESTFSRAARRNEEEAARGTDWERTKTAEGKRKWRQKRAMLAGTWSRGPGTRLTRGLYSADRLDPRSATPGIVREQEQKMVGRAARSREYQRRRRAIAATYPTLARPLEPDMAAWGKRAPPPFYTPGKPRIEGKLLKWRPASLEHSNTDVADVWRTRWVEFRVEAEAHPKFETLAEEQQCLVTEVVDDLRSLGKSHGEIEAVLQSIKHPLRERRAPDKDIEELLFSAEAEDRRKRRRLRPVLSYCHSRGGRQLGRLDLCGATLTRSYRPEEAQQVALTRPLMPSDLQSNTDKICASNSRWRLHTLVGEGPRAHLLKDLCRACIKAGWQPRELCEADRVLESTGPRLPDAACGRPYLTVTAKDPHGGRPHVLPPEPSWERHVKQLCDEVGGSSRLDAALALVETHGDPRKAKARIRDRTSSPNLEDVKALLQTSIVFTTTSATFSCDKTAAAAEEYLQSWFEQFRYAVWETDLSTGRSPLETTSAAPKQQPPPQTGPLSFNPPGGPQDGPVHKVVNHPAYYQPPPASLYAVRAKLRQELDVSAQRFVPSRGGLYRNMTDEMEADAATRAAMQWRAGGKATNGGVRWAPRLDDRKAAVMKALANVSEGTAAGKSVGEVAAEAA
jgi:hypothetical protein